MVCWSQHHIPKRHFGFKRYFQARIQFIKTPEFVSKRNERKLIRRMSSNLIDLDLNDDLKNVTHRRNRTEDNWLSLFDSLFDSPTAAASSTNTTNKKESKRQYIIAEIMSTEQNYVDSLKSLMNVYRRVATDNAGRFGWLSMKSIGIVFDELIPLAMMHEKLLSDIKRVVEKRVVPTSSSSSSSSTPTLDNTDPFSSIPSAYSAGLLPSTKSIDKKDIFDLVFDSPSLRMDEELKKPVKLDETTLMSDVTQNLVDVFSSSSQPTMLSSPQKHNHPPPLPPRNNSSSDVKAPDLLNITRVPTGFGGFKPSKKSSPTIRFAAQLSAERRARHQRSPSQHRTETLVSPKKKNTDECETVEEAIGIVFATYAHFFSCTRIDNIHTYEERISHLRRKIKQKSNWGKFCEGQKQTHGLDIFSLMIQPVQRMPRYRLLILELLKSTPDDATYRGSLKDALNLQRALEISRSATTSIFFYRSRYIYLCHQRNKATKTY